MAEEDRVVSEDEPSTMAGNPPVDPVRRWTFIVLGACAVLLTWYLIADRFMPYSGQARVNALVIPIAAEVSGTVSEVAVGSNQFVEAGDLLFSIDRSRYLLAVEAAQANLQSARQETGASTANVDAAEAQLVSARATLVRAEQDATRLRRIKQEDSGAISDRQLENAESTLAITKGQLRAAEANLDLARQQLGASGDENSRILQAQSALAQAQIDLARTEVRAPADGVVTDVRVDRGNFAQAGSAQMTFLGTHNVWLQADFTENNLGHIEPGDAVEIVFDVLPGRVVKGKIRSTGFGVAVDEAPLGSLPTIDNDREFLRSAQRFSVLVDFDLPHERERLGIRVGAQASVMVYTGENWLLNGVGKLLMRLESILTYAY